MICPACGNECRLITIDNGIGAYEYWGARGVDVQLAEVTDCCEADPDDDPGYDDDDEPDPGRVTELDVAGEK